MVGSHPAEDMREIIWEFVELFHGFKPVMRIKHKAPSLDALYRKRRLIMNTVEPQVSDANQQKIRERTEVLFQERRDKMARRGDKILSMLMVFQWVLGIALALILSPHTWHGAARSIHPHVYLAIFLGGILSAVPVIVAKWSPGSSLTRHVMATAQMLWSAMLIHLTGGRIETHFHVFVSLAFFSLYFDWSIYVTAPVVLVGDHLVRGALIPESVYGIVNPEWWRFLEHAAWVVFCTAFLIISCRRHIREWLAAAEEGGMIEALAESEWKKGSVIDRPDDVAQAK